MTNKMNISLQLAAVISDVYKKIFSENPVTSDPLKNLSIDRKSSGRIISRNRSDGSTTLTRSGEGERKGTPYSFTRTEETGRRTSE